MTCFFYTNPNALSHVQCKRHESNAQININTPKGIVRGQLSLTFLHHVLDSIPKKENP